MNRLTLFGIVWSLAISVGWAQEATTSTENSSPIPPVAGPSEDVVPGNSQAIALILNAAAKQSEVVKQVVEALEKAGIATSKAAETAPTAKSLISVTLGMRNDESHEKIKQLIEALRNVGVQQISLRAAGSVKAKGDEEQSVLIMNTYPGYTTDEWQKIKTAATTAAEKCGLSLIVAEPLDIPRTGVASTASEGANQEKPIDETKGAFNAATEVSASVIQVFALKNSQATSTTELLMQLITVAPFRAVADESHNSVVVIGSTEQLQAVEALLLKLDEAPREPSAEPKHDGKSTVGEDASKQIQQQVTQLSVACETANKLAHELAQSLRQTPDAAKKAELRTAVQRAFTLRQSLLRAELLEMQTRMLQTQQSLDMRERITDQIVDRRVEDLLNPQLEWEQTLSGELDN